MASSGRSFLDFLRPSRPSSKKSSTVGEKSSTVGATVADSSYVTDALLSSFANSEQHYKEWRITLLARAKSEFELRYNSTSNASYSRSHLKNPVLSDFEIIKTIGRGAFGHVHLVRYLPEDGILGVADKRKSVKSVSSTHQATTSRFRFLKHQQDRYYALKVLEKEKIVKSKQIKSVIVTKHILEAVRFPFINRFECAFKDNANLFIVLEYVDGGDMFDHLKKVKRFSEEQVRFFTSQLILVFEYLHHLDLIHRDLKPENVLIASDGFIKLTDFGFAKIVKGRTYTMCGTPEYFAPEILLKRGYGKSADWWTLGIFTYEMCAGRTPFKAEKEMEMYENILKGEFVCPEHFSQDLEDLMRHCIEPNLTRRFGNLKGGADDIKGHPWFSSVNWQATYERSVPAPYSPSHKGPSVDTGGRTSGKSGVKKVKEVQIAISDVDAFKMEFADF